MTSPFIEALESIRAGGREMLYRPPFLSCAGEVHEPFRLMDQPMRVAEDAGLLEEDRFLPETYLWGTVKTTSWDFTGDRTDLNDIWSLCWAAFLRAAGIASPILVDEDGWCGPEELSARHLLVRPESWVRDDGGTFEEAKTSMNAWTAFAFHLMDGAFDWQRAGKRIDFSPADVHTPAGEWIEPILRTLRRPKAHTAIKRICPTWIYFSALPRGISIVRLSSFRFRALKRVLATYSPRAAPGEAALAIFANGIANGVPFETIRLAMRLMKKSGDACATPLILPIDSHCLFLGDKTLIAIREDCSRKVYDAERNAFLARRSAEDHVFFADSRIDWLYPLDAGEFEDLCLDLLRREPGVVRAKPVGGVNDRDGGRDILVDWLVPRSHVKPGKRQAQHVRILAQVKSRGRTVGKGDVQDIRDTLERYDAQGFFLIVHPRASAALVDHLDDLVMRTSFIVNWWERRDLEGRLRRHPDIARRYPSLVRLTVRDGR